MLRFVDGGACINLLVWRAGVLLILCGEGGGLLFAFGLCDGKFGAKDIANPTSHRLSIVRGGFPFSIFPGT